MKSRESAVRMQKFEAQERARKVQGLEQMIRDFEVMAVDLERQVQAEEDRTGVKDNSHFAYSTFAKAASQRRNKLRASIDELRMKLAEAMRDRDETPADGEAPPQPRSAGRSRRRIERSPLMMAR